jgi:putative endonuclease
MEKSYTYILECGDGSLYTGWTINLEERLKTHNEGRGAKYTQRRLPVKLVYTEEFDTRAKACQRECQIKELSRKEKLELISKRLT